jgi:septal ring factor EnvC (AmiA/AmiB activator)
MIKTDCTITFSPEGVDIGTLFWDGVSFHFEGDADSSAQAFFDAMNRLTRDNLDHLKRAEKAERIMSDNAEIAREWNKLHNKTMDKLEKAEAVVKELEEGYSELGSSLETAVLKLRKAEEENKRLRESIENACRLADLADSDCCSYHRDAIAELQKAWLCFMMANELQAKAEAEGEGE